MRIPSNHIKSITGFFREELKGLYDADEIENFIFYSFEHHLGYSRTDLLLKANETVSESELLKFNGVVKRLKREEPIQYILGEAWFYGLKLNVNPSVLIPRPETEELVDWIFKEFKVGKLESWRAFVKEGQGAGGKGQRILDIGTGSGCIAIALKKELPDAEVFAMDISPDLLGLAKENALLNNVVINCIQEDILKSSNFPTFQPSNLNIIVSNPPYVLQSEKSGMKSNVLAHEPHLALFVNDNDPLIFYGTITQFAKKHLVKEGKLFFEVNESKAEDVKKLLLENGFNAVEIKKDLSGKERMVKASLTNNNS